MQRLQLLVVGTCLVGMLGCQEKDLRRASNRPSADDAKVPGYEAQTIETAKAGKPLTIKLESTTVKIPEGSVGKDAEVRLRTLLSAPEREELVELGDPKGDVVELTFYEKNSGEVFSSNLLSEPYDLGQTLDDVVSEADLKYVVITSPDTEGEEIQIITSDGIDKLGLSLMTAKLSVSVKLSVTYAIIYAVESNSVLANVITIDSGKDLSNNGGTTTTVSTAPNPPTGVVDGTSHDSLSESPSLSWTASSSEAATSYEVAIGTSSGGTDIKDWSDVGLVTSAQITGLSLSNNATYYASVRAKNGEGEVSSAAVGDGWTVSISSGIDCSGLSGGVWIPVPKNPAVGQDEDFCVMKFEAKDVGSTATSQASGSPWVLINRNDARAKCADLGTGQSEVTYTLITNAMWQTVARNIETAKDGETYLNWSNGSTSGDNALNRGHSDDAPSSGLAVTDEGDPCSGTGQSNCTDNTSTDFRQKRTHTLSNGAVIWDLAGNVWEWVYDDNTTSQGSNGYISQSPMNDQSKWGPEGNYSSKNSGERGGLGYFYNGSSGAVYRGGAWSDNAGAGMFYANLYYDPSYADLYIGFRCAAVR